jgi:hypothetical protein
VLVFLRELAGSSRSSALCACSFQLLLIYDVESALSVLAAASAAIGACCLLARSARKVQAPQQSVRILEASKQMTARSSATQESQLNTILNAVAGVCESVDGRFTLVQEAIADKPDIEQIKKTISEELSHAVQERLKVTIQQKMVSAIREEVTRTVQQQVSEVVH